MDPASCHFENQEKDEQVVLILRSHPITNLGWIVVTIVLALVGLGTFLVLVMLPAITKFFDSQDLVIFLLAWLTLLAGFAIQRYLSWYFNVNLVTNKKIVDVDFLHLFYKQISQTSLENVQDITTHTGGVFQNHFDYGDVVIQTAGEMANFEFLLVPDPEGVQKKIMELASLYRKETGAKPL
ncbi:MAG: hypothetical protein A3F35_02420 [Candidatus Woykebacteria bacterium RIFCSPHIGHO2_12_FULL_45_10]|uniref:YdbS-like PH domain-containing protein n=1 Tax=Candidatus Woykebacteria bacterium RIFCSPHIGHO2_12_FULL_45_10 TaxID=1802603 RepID=A0A1G1WMU9_9BACT|nr:MAG: hypothetical protein A3F35_02420 [Candidatus Woykebacteria bacterium RIFCSPHIGHO2_12_FULL_45_10]